MLLVVLILSILVSLWHSTLYILGPGARFSKVPRLFARIAGDLVLFVINVPRRLEVRNFAPILILFPLQHMKRPDLKNERVAVLRMAFRARKVFGTFEKRAQVGRAGCTNHLIARLDSLTDAVTKCNLSPSSSSTKREQQTLPLQLFSVQ